jgi:hypothetical protein
MVLLSNELLIGRGISKNCYQHPNDENLCIKINHNKCNQWTEEKQCYQYLKNQNIDLSKLAEFHGIIETNLGQGLVFELVKDDSGNISKPLSYYIENKSFKNSEKLIDLIEELKQYLLEHSLFYIDLNEDNILYQIKAGKPRLRIINGIKNYELIKFDKFFETLARIKIHRIFNQINFVLSDKLKTLIF